MISAKVLAEERNGMSDSFGLKRVLGLKELVAIEIGTTIGAGVFALTGIAAGMTGSGVPLAYLLAAVPIVFVMMTVAMLGSALPTVGGTYRYPSRLFSPAWAFLGVWTYALGMVFGAFPLYGQSCAEYLQAIFPGLPLRPTAIAILTFFYLINLRGIQIAAGVQGLMVLVMVAALIYFGAAGMPAVQVENFQNLLPKGIGGLVLAACLLTFTLQGSNAVIELGAEIKDPGRAVPLSLLISIPTVTLIYLVIAVVAVGVVPWQQAASLTAPALKFMGRAGYHFFILGGAVLAITTTINATFMWATKSLMVLARDQLFPASLARTSRRGVPQRFLTLLWALSVAALLLGKVPLQTFASYASIGGNFIFIPVMVSALLLRKKIPEIYERAPFRLRGFLLWFCPGVGMVLSALAIVMLVADLKQMAWPLLGWLALGVLFFLWQSGRLGGKDAAGGVEGFQARIQADRDLMVEETLKLRGGEKAAPSRR
jgi:APA family basic amino acid/polyamine antiporter